MRTYEVPDESEGYDEGQAQNLPYPGAVPITPQYGTGRGGFVVNSGPPPEGARYGQPVPTPNVTFGPQPGMSFGPQPGMSFGPQPGMPDVERDIRAARQQKASGRTPMNSFAKERVKFLLGIGQLTRDVPVGGTVFSLRTLKGRESREALSAAASVPQIEVLFEGRRQQLARSIYKIDGVDTDTAMGTYALEDKLEILDEMDDNLMNHLYSQFSELNEEATNKFAIKPDENIEELVADVKK